MFPCHCGDCSCRGWDVLANVVIAPAAVEIVLAVAANAPASSDIDLGKSPSSPPPPPPLLLLRSRVIT